MEKVDFWTSIKSLEIAYNKKYSPDELKLMYSMVNDIDRKTFDKAIINLIKSSKFIPNISQIREECKNIKKNDVYESINKLKDTGVIKTSEEETKLFKFIDKGIIPSWINENITSEDMNEDEVNELKKELGWDYE